MLKRGFTIFLAMLVSSLALAIGLAIYDLVSRELVLSQVSNQSQYAIFAADAGAECALYWDNKCTPTVNPSCTCTQTNSSGTCTNGTAFPTSTLSNNPTTGLVCGNYDITNNTVLSYPWSVLKNAGDATVTFKISSSTIGGPCATVVVTKTGNPAQTTIVSRGYNTCAATGVVRVERALQLTY